MPCCFAAQALGDDVIDSVVGENIAILTEEEKYNETVQSSVNRVVAVLSGKEDPGAPVRCATLLPWGAVSSSAGVPLECMGCENTASGTGSLCGHAPAPTGVCTGATAVLGWVPNTRPSKKMSPKHYTTSSMSHS